MINEFTPSTAHVPDQLLKQFKRTVEVQDAIAGRTPSALCDRIETLARELSWHPCGSPRAALYMLGVIASEAQALADFSQMDNVAPARVEVTADSLTRMVGSVTRWVEQSHDIRREDYRLDYYGCEATERQHWGLPPITAETDESDDA